MLIKKSLKYFILPVGVFTLLALNLRNPLAAPLDDIKPDSRCAVCGMFVAKYEVWITQIRHNDESLDNFDGVKDMMAYYLHPEKYGSHTKDSIREMWVKDYYSLKWLDAKKAFYVVGSDVHGPMGHEFIPFSTRAAAEAFMKDHHGEKMYAFDEITGDIVGKLRSGSKMKH